jgi:hypothetical protein
MQAQLAGRGNAQSVRFTTFGVADRQTGERRIHRRGIEPSSSLWSDFLAALSVATAVAIVAYMIWSVA